MKNLTIASTNFDRVNKIKEVITDLFPYLNIFLLPSNIVPPLENGVDVEENAQIKASYYSNLINMPVLIIDSGIYFENCALEDSQNGHNIHNKIIELEKNGENIIEYWTKYFIKNTIISGYIQKVFILKDKKNIVSTNLKIPFKINFPENKELLLSSSNPLNHFMVPYLFDKTYHMFNKEDRKKYEKMYTNEAIIKLFKNFKENENID